MQNGPPHKIFQPSTVSYNIIYFSVLLMACISHPAHAYETISLKEYPTLATKIANPVNLMRLDKTKTFQINTDHYILQFFFNGQNLLGIIFKRDLSKPIHLRWCFFRSCEENPFDYKVVIANPHQAPFKDNYFEVKYPPGLHYQFQGLHFSSGN